jgi:hypothetical protein
MYQTSEPQSAPYYPNAEQQTAVWSTPTQPKQRASISPTALLGALVLLVLIVGGVAIGMSLSGKSSSLPIIHSTSVAKPRTITTAPAVVAHTAPVNTNTAPVNTAPVNTAPVNTTPVNTTSVPAAFSDTNNTTSAVQTWWVQIQPGWNQLGNDLNAVTSAASSGSLTATQSACQSLLSDLESMSNNDPVAPNPALNNALDQAGTNLGNGAEACLSGNTATAGRDFSAAAAPLATAEQILASDGINARPIGG